MAYCTSCHKYIVDPGPDARYCEYCGQARVTSCGCLEQNTPQAVAQSSIIHGLDSLCDSCGRVFLYLNQAGGYPQPVGTCPISQELVDLYPSAADPDAHRAWLAQRPSVTALGVPEVLALGPRASTPVSRHGRLYAVRANGDLDCWAVPRGTATNWTEPRAWTRVQTGLRPPFAPLQVSEGYVYYLTGRGTLAGHPLGSGSTGDRLEVNLGNLREPQFLIHRNHLLACGLEGPNWLVGHLPVQRLTDPAQGPGNPNILYRIGNAPQLGGLTSQIKAGGDAFFVRTASHSLLSVRIDNGETLVAHDLDRNPDALPVKDWAVRGPEALVLRAAPRPTVQLFGAGGEHSAACVLSDQHGNDLSVHAGSSALIFLDDRFLVLTADLTLTAYGLEALRGAARDGQSLGPLHTWEFAEAYNQQAEPRGLHVLTWNTSIYVILHTHETYGDRLLGLRLDQAEGRVTLFTGIQFPADHKLELTWCGPLLMCFARSTGAGTLHTVDVTGVLG